MLSNIYRPLDHTADEIRLLTLTASESAFSSIHLELRHVSLDDRPVYQALSYVWGTEPAEHRVSVNGQSTLVTPNLYAALCELPKQFTNLRLWCDALCIHQADVDERNNQVHRMGHIYGGAQRVLI